MKYFWTLFWTFLLCEMLSYVVCSMVGSEFKVETGAMLAVGFTILILIIPAIIPNDKEEKHIH
ncbi:YjzD family protein [Neobacillus terrae]|uniref:YjzD family protein n=1 Tax=Neobacillus terrae TaxID=3034837 RepID=UPI00140B4D7E|nr:YjzD family protein [Neobacillus terrae]NHM32929.1 YjzD family protein [Neobacillus terrae]